MVNVRLQSAILIAWSNNEEQDLADLVSSGDGADLYQLNVFEVRVFKTAILRAVRYHQQPQRLCKGICLNLDVLYLERLVPIED